VYEIHIDNDGDAQEDITFQFHFSTARKDIALTIGPPGNQRTNAIPLVQAGQITSMNNGALNVLETYTIRMIKGTAHGRSARRGERHRWLTDFHQTGGLYRQQNAARL